MKQIQRQIHRRMALAVVCALLAGCVGTAPMPPSQQPAGAPPSAKTQALGAGAAIFQTDAPLGGMDTYLVGFHPLKDDPAHQFEAHHFCKEVNEDFAQCALFDGNTKDANMHGIEYIISERLFESLPAEERQYWHPHNGEILSGQLVAPGLPEVADTAAMRSKLNSYGKTWHTWDTGVFGGSGDALPFGPARLAWSFNRFGEAKPGLVESRDQRMGISTEDRRAARQELIPLAHPQEGVDSLKGRFEGPTKPIPGVVDKSAGPGE